MERKGRAKSFYDEYMTKEGFWNAAKVADQELGREYVKAAYNKACECGRYE